LATRIERDTEIPQSKALLALFGNHGWILVDLEQMYVDRMKRHEDMPKWEEFERAVPVTGLKFLRTYIFLRKPSDRESRNLAYHASGCEPALRIVDLKHERWAGMRLHHPHQLLMFTRIRCDLESLVCFRPQLRESAPLELSYKYVLTTFKKYFKNVTFAELADETATSQAAGGCELLVK
jgi:hypothetical protein